MNIIQGAVQALTKNAVELAPESWLPGGKPDPLSERTGGQIGTPISRLDGPLKVKGAARFAAEFPMEVMVYVALAFSAIPKERIVELDTSAAEGALGVLLVMTHKNAPSMKPTPVFLTAEKAAGGDDLPIMQDDRVHRNGQPIAVVLGETQEQADHAASLICATYEAEEATTSFEAAKAQGTEPGVFQGEPLQIIIRRSRSRAGSCAVQGRCHLPHPATQSQCDRAACGDTGLERR